MHTVSTENCTSLHERLLTKSNAGCFVCVITDLAWDWTSFQRLYFLPSIVFAALASKLSMMTEWQLQEGARLLANSKTVPLSTADLFSCRIGFSASPTRPCWSLFCFYWWRRCPRLPTPVPPRSRHQHLHPRRPACRKRMAMASWNLRHPECLRRPSTRGGVKEPAQDKLFHLAEKSRAPKKAGPAATDRARLR